MDTLPIQHQTITAIVENVALARADIAQAFTLLQGAKDRLNATLGTKDQTYYAYGYLWNRDISDYNLDRTAKEVDQFQERNAWRYVLEQTGLRAYMTEARQKELQAQLEKGTFPPLTVENALSTLQGLTSHVGSLLTESALEVFDWLRPSTRSQVGQLKTNHQFHIGHKAIVYGVESNWNDGYRINSYREANFRALGNVFSLMDGQGAQQRPNDLVTQLNVGLRAVRSGGIVTTPYLTCKPYANGNAHLAFLRQDLVDKLNQVGADGSLPGREAA